MENIVVENANIVRAKIVLKDDYQHMSNLNKERLCYKKKNI
jgi:hypothetical protein